MPASEARCGTARRSSVWADKGHVSAEHEAAFKGPGKVWDVMRKAPGGGKLDPLDERINRVIAMVRARVEHPSGSSSASSAM